MTFDFAVDRFTISTFKKYEVVVFLIVFTINLSISMFDYSMVCLDDTIFKIADFHAVLFILIFVMKQQQIQKQEKNDIRDVGSTADLVLIFLVHLVHWYLVHWYPLVPDGT